MSAFSEQIVLLYKMRETPVSIAQMLGVNEDEVLLILEGRGLLTLKNITKYQEMATINNSAAAPPTENPPEGSTTSISLITPVEEVTPAKVYEEYQLRIAKNVCRIAASEESETLPAGVIVKAAIYANEEATGRNDARAKKNLGHGLLLNMAQMMRDIELAQTQVDRALGINKNTTTIDVLSEKYA